MARMALRRICQRRLTTYVAIVCFVYIMMVFVFLTDISPQVSQNDSDDQSEIENNVVMQAKSIKHRGVLDKYRDLLNLKFHSETIDVADALQLAIVDSVPRKCVGKQTEDIFQFKEVFKNIFIYSTFLDIRENDFEGRDNGSSAIRMMAILHTKMKKDYPKLYCLGVLNSGQQWSERVTFYEMCENHNMRYGSFILSCRLPKELWQTPPCSVLVSSSTVPSNTSEWFRVQSSMKTRRHKVEVCVPPLFGKINMMDLIEFIELTRLFGAERIHFYNAGVSPSILAVLAYYRKRNIVSVLPWELDERLKRKKHLHYNGQSVNIQDCLYRNMFSTHFLAFMDVDEMVVPRKHTNWFSMITSATNYSQHAGFSISSVFFDPNWGLEDDSGEVGIRRRIGLHKLTDFIRTKQLSRFRTKCIVNPRLIFEIGIHHISKPIVATLQTVKLLENYVLLHHYRSCDGRFGMKCRERVTDKTLLHYATELETAVSQVLFTMML